MEVLFCSARPLPRFFFLSARSYSKETINARLRHARERAKLAPETGSPHGESSVTVTKEPNPSSGRKVEAYGKPRDMSSNAAKTERLKESLKIEKALLHEKIGENIYAYLHIRTGQVVYSLTRIMNNAKVMSQLIFHGKKTVPAALRRDMWTPYFSLHFPSSHSGLLAYHRLRELSVRRQLSAPSKALHSTVQTASESRRKRMTHQEEMEWDHEHEGQEHPDGIARRMDKYGRAKAMMQQRTTSVADAAFVITLLHDEGQLVLPDRAAAIIVAGRQRALAKAGVMRQKKLKRRWNEERERAQKMVRVSKRAWAGSKWGLDRWVARRIAVEHGGSVVGHKAGQTRVIIPGAEETVAATKEALYRRYATNTSTTTPTETNSSAPVPPVRIFWADLTDAAYAQKWPAVVTHGEFERFGVSRSQTPRDNGDAVVRLRDRSVHVMGTVRQDGDFLWARKGGGDVELKEAEEKRRRLMEQMPAAGDKGDGEGQGEGSVDVVVPKKTGLLDWVKGRFGR